MPYVIRSAVNVRQPTPKQLRSPFWSFEPRVTGIPLHPGATIVLEDEAFRANEAALKQMFADDLITISGNSEPVSVVEDPKPLDEIPAAPVEAMPTPEEVVAAVEQDNAKVQEAVPEAAPEPVAEKPVKPVKPSNKRG